MKALAWVFSAWLATAALATQDTTWQDAESQVAAGQLASALERWTLEQVDGEIQRLFADAREKPGNSRAS